MSSWWSRTRRYFLSVGVTLCELQSVHTEWRHVVDGEDLVLQCCTCGLTWCGLVPHVLLACTTLAGSTLGTGIAFAAFDVLELASRQVGLVEPMRTVAWWRNAIAECVIHTVFVFVTLSSHVHLAGRCLGDRQDAIHGHPDLHFVMSLLVADGDVEMHVIWSFEADLAAIIYHLANG